MTTLTWFLSLAAVVAAWVDADGSLDRLFPLLNPNVNTLNALRIAFVLSGSSIAVLGSLRIRPSRLALRHPHRPTVVLAWLPTSRPDEFRSGQRLHIAYRRTTPVDPNPLTRPPTR